MSPLKILIAGLGNMGRSHAIACARHPGFEVVGLVNRSPVADLPESLASVPMHSDYHAALESVECDVVSINTYSDTHAEYAIAAMEKGRHVFLEKPMATTVEDARRVVAVANRLDRKLVVGYILRHHPSWVRLIQEARDLGGPYVFRLNLNQQSSGATWKTHLQLMQSTSPLVDCGVHYVDVMCQITDALPVQVNGMGVRLTESIEPEMYNYGHFQVRFDDGSVGWYEAGWGPMMSETAFFVKDIISPNGAVSIVMDDNVRSDDIDAHTRTSRIRLHRAELNEAGEFSKPDTLLDMHDEPDHQGLCDNEQAFLHDAIVNNTDLTRHWRDAVQSLRICIAADESVRSGKAVDL
ncbi:Gfo/Idh/MocA family protein [Granulosicoccus antarcticus]|uniref:Inositol 2-dehydrogenase n=1 Tax=Granulosicoccus antarcticus IMCC3135 TaxID=1192854 RepID=A0A2Z2NIJ1_9GAMM|nr:Gfo/Idh/MocA family oxidoreductase [Granulosicoccus antarcticus]ASJ70295.1 Inositol 2-dehydrogenase [Granulosicoccus antarcticus IMCC3135]